MTPVRARRRRVAWAPRLSTPRSQGASPSSPSACSALTPRSFPRCSRPSPPPPAHRRRCSSAVLSPSLASEHTASSRHVRATQRTQPDRYHALHRGLWPHHHHSPLHLLRAHAHWIRAVDRLAYARSARCVHAVVRVDALLWRSLRHPPASPRRATSRRIGAMDRASHAKHAERHAFVRHAPPRQASLKAGRGMVPRRRLIPWRGLMPCRRLMPRRGLLPSGSDRVLARGPRRPSTRPPRSHLAARRVCCCGRRGR
jgi:hypothetical protein